MWSGDQPRHVQYSDPDHLLSTSSGRDGAYHNGRGHFEIDRGKIGGHGGRFL